jgi:RHS repeat-associated protein
VVRNGVLIARYAYDVLGRRIVKRVYSMQTGADTLYLRMVYTGSQVAFETDSAGTIGLRYTWGPGSDNLLAIEDASGNHYYATTDRLGSIRTLAKRDGTWLLTRRWDPYGNEISRDSSASFTWGKRLRYGWTGREYDVEIGMYYHRARYYSQSLRRFIQEDPVEGSTSPYAYVHGSPLEAADPSGMMDSYEMRMPDPRERELLAGHVTGMIDGVSYDGNAGWLSGIVRSGGATYASTASAFSISWNRQFALLAQAQAAGRRDPDDDLALAAGADGGPCDRLVRAVAFALCFIDAGQTIVRTMRPSQPNPIIYSEPLLPRSFQPPGADPYIELPWSSSPAGPGSGNPPGKLVVPEGGVPEPPSPGGGLVPAAGGIIRSTTPFDMLPLLLFPGQRQMIMRSNVGGTLEA